MRADGSSQGQHLGPSEGYETWYRYDDANELCWGITGTDPGSTSCAGDPAGDEIRYTHDGNGSLLTSTEGLSASYNSRNQTNSMTAPGGSPVSMGYADVTQDERVAAGADTFTYDLLGMSSQTTSGQTAYVTRQVG